MANFLSTISDPNDIITAIDASVRFPESMVLFVEKYQADIEQFKSLALSSKSSDDLLIKIRDKSFDKDRRMSLLKIFRRCVSPVLDTEMAKKITKVPTESLIKSIGHTFKDIALVKSQFSSLDSAQISALACLLGEYDSRGTLGYLLTNEFFNWFESTFSSQYSISGPRGAGRDIELSSIFPNFKGDYPCDFVIKDISTNKVRAVGFCRYDSTRGGAQSDDRTGGNSDKVSKAEMFCQQSGEKFKLIFLSDGPGMAHKDTWHESCKLDGMWDGNVLVTTLKTAPIRITAEWLELTD
jgi:hypothetical protein